MLDMTAKAMIPLRRKVLKRLHYPLEVMLACFWWASARWVMATWRGSLR